MPQIGIFEIQYDGVSKHGLLVLKAAVKHAVSRQDIREHGLPLDYFCDLAETGKLSGEQMRLLLAEGQRVGVCAEVIDADDPDNGMSKFSRIPVFGEIDADDYKVVFEV